MNSLGSLMLAMLVWCVSAGATAAPVEQAPIELKKGQTLTATGSSVLQLELTTSAGVKTVSDVATSPAFRDTLTLDDALVASIKPRIPPTGVQSALLLSDADKVALARFPIRAAGTPAADGTRPRPLAGYDTCKAVAKQWQVDNTDDWKGGENVLLVLFNHEAALCYESNLTPHQGDTVLTGFVYTDDVTVEKSSVALSQCSDRQPEPNILVTGVPKSVVQQAGEGFGLHIASRDRCWDNEITLTASVKLQGADAKQGTRKVSFYPRYQATLQLGVMYTDLHKADFGLRDSAGQNVIYNKAETNSGPEYVASLVFYGLPNYFIDDGFKGGYHGRDIINENSIADRIGFMILAGIDEPGDRFGVGLSFELAYGINLFVTRQWFKQRQLVGVSEGDVFAGAAEDITTKLDWEDDTAVGLSFDMRYLSKLWKGQ